MIRLRLAALALAALFFAAPSFAIDSGFRAPSASPSLAIALDAPTGEAAAAPGFDASERYRVGSVRPLAKAERVETWTRVPGGFVATLSASSTGAQGLRVQLLLPERTSAVEVRVQGEDARIETMRLASGAAREAWTPWTAGATQRVELFSAQVPRGGAVTVVALAHFTASPLAKAAASCTISTMCSTGDPSLDEAISERKKSVMKIQFVDARNVYVCSATLVDTPRNPAPYLLTANHCVNSDAAAASVTSFWFYETSACDSSVPNPDYVQLSTDSQLVFTNFNADSTLLLMSVPAPTGATYAPLDPARVAPGQRVVSLSHPDGDTMRYAIGTSGQLVRDNDRPYDMYEVTFSQGIIEPGSSGSGLFTLENGTLALRGLLSQADVALSCTDPTAPTLYPRLEVFYPEIAQYIGATTVAADDAPNRPQDLFNKPVDITGADLPLNARTAPVAIDNLRIDYPGDLDVFRFILTQPGAVSVWTEGTTDTVGTILDEFGTGLEANDDAQTSSTNFGITRQLGPGTYYVSVGAWDPQGTGTYSLHMRADNVGTNYTDLWWNPAEPGWGVNINHQGNTLFATLFTYDANGNPLWLVMSAGTLQADATYQGTLYRTTGSAFNAPWAASTPTAVGTMTFAFTSPSAGTMTYTFNGTPVTKSITRQAFSTPATTCTWSAFDRSFTTNFQDLWFDPSEPGWGVNLAQQGNTVFATLFTYDASGKPLWLVMSNGAQAGGATYSGPLYRTSGPAFNASPWTAAVPTQVGTMTLTFTNGNAGTLSYVANGVSVTKPIQRQVFSTPRPSCG